MKLLLIAAFCAFSLFSSEEIKLEGPALFKPHTLQDVDVYHSPQGFKISKDGMMQLVHKCYTDEKLRNITQKNLFEFLNKGGYIDFNKVGDEFKLTAKVRGNGGGPVGATVGVVAGATAVQGAYWGLTSALTVAAVAVAGPVAGPAAIGVWCFWTAAPVAVLTKTAAIAGGIAGAVATGPL